ncbi:FtsX-like permease family protein, partial [Microbacterium sp. 13-71-7]|uniref:FtsX-like permease family protein n=1 Tax=Microbacterium sp. 13-71-7 TaxID=1970399 RepID=UPI000BC3BAD0
MIRLLLGELRADWRAWAGLVLVAAVAGLTIGIGGSFLETGLHVGGRTGTGIGGAASMILVFGGVSAIAVTSAVARLAVDLGRSGYARWQLCGVTPRQTAAVVLGQVMVLSLSGAALGLWATALLAPFVLRLAFEGASGGYDTVTAVVGPLTAILVAGGVLLVALLGGLPAARRAARTPALEALRESEPRGATMRWWRWALFALMTAGMVAAVQGWMSSAAAVTPGDRNTLISQTPLIAPLLTAVIVAGGPVLYAPLLRAWTALLPTRVSAAWFLARHQARYHLGRSTASITPLLAGTAMLGGLDTVIATWGAAARAAGEPFEGLKPGQMIVLLGGPLLLAGVGAAVVVFMSNRTQAREQALLSAGGATTAVIVRAAVLQALVHVCTAALLSAAVIVVTGVLTTAMLRPFYPAVAPQLALGSAVILVGAGAL